MEPELVCFDGSLVAASAAVIPVTEASAPDCDFAVPFGIAR